MICYLSRWNKLQTVLLSPIHLKSRPFGTHKRIFCISLWGVFLFILPIKLVWSPRHHYRVGKDLENWISTWEIGFGGIGFLHWSMNDSSTLKRRVSFGYPCRPIHKTLDHCYSLLNCTFLLLAFLLLSLA